MQKFLNSVDLLLNWLDGKKTYILSIVAGGTGAAMAAGVHIPDWLLIIEGALGLGSLRAAVSKAN